MAYISLATWSRFFKFWKTVIDWSLLLHQRSFLPLLLINSTHVPDDTTILRLTDVALCKSSVLGSFWWEQQWDQTLWGLLESALGIQPNPRFLLANTETLVWFQPSRYWKRPGSFLRFFRKMLQLKSSQIIGMKLSPSSICLYCCQRMLIWSQKKKLQTEFSLARWL